MRTEQIIKKWNRKSWLTIEKYNISTSSGRSSLKGNINKQYNQRLDNLPEDTLQTVIIDIRGQDVPN